MAVLILYVFRSQKATFHQVFNVAATMPPIFNLLSLPDPVASTTIPQISPDRIRLNSPVTLVKWATEEGGGGGEIGAAASSTKTYRDGHPSHPCVVEYSTTRSRARDPSGAGGGREKDEVCTRRVRCKRVVVTVSLGVLKVRRLVSSTPFC